MKENSILGDGKIVMMAKGRNREKESNINQENINIKVVSRMERDKAMDR
jgi:hypothetical protein